MNKIVFVLPSLKTGGGNRVVIELANQLVLNNICVDIVYPNNSGEIHTFNYSKEINFIKIGKEFSSKIGKLVNIFLLVLYLSKNYKNKIIIFTDPIMSILIPLVRNNNLIRFIQADDYRIFDDLMILKNKFFLLVYKLLIKKSYNYKIDFVFNSKYTYHKYIEISKKRIEYNVIHPALNHNIFFNKNIRKDKELNICIIARKHPLKGFIDFIEPFNKGRIQGIDNVYIISHDDLSEFDLSNVTLIKPKNDKEISYYMNLSHIFISTSWWEGFGLPSLEAMACGCSVILSDAGGVNEYAECGVNCLVFEPRKQEKLIESIEILLRDFELRNELSKNAILRAKTFSWENSKKQLLNIIRNKYATN